MLHATRYLFGAFSMAMSFLSLADFPVTNNQILGHLASVLFLPLAAFLSKKRISKAINSAIAFGFSGVILLLQDPLVALEDHAEIGVFAGLAYAFTMTFLRVHTKTMTHTKSAPVSA
ncbi:hypothetical protein [Planktotalea sp.]|uniref:hypothetical protein n=1 Tax=Planktotalea sp. TaxID=2029877 RepID=UPI0025F71F16|nr:hypothetical protein [Planktotalea sp.]